MYQIPNCDCGGSLEYHQDIIHTFSSSIKSNGRISKRMSIAKVSPVPISDRFVCQSCNKAYEAVIDKRNRIVLNKDKNK